MDKYTNVGLFTDGVGRVFDVDGKELPVKKGNQNLQVNYRGNKYSVSKLPIRTSPNDPVFDYIFNGGFINYPCPAMDYWIYRWRLGKKISIQQYKEKFLV